MNQHGIAGCNVALMQAGTVRISQSFLNTEFEEDLSDNTPYSPACCRRRPIGRSDGSQKDTSKVTVTYTLDTYDDTK